MHVLFKDQEIQRLLDDYQKLVGVRIAVFDTDFNELYSSPKTISDFCKSVRFDDTINTACRHCDQKAFRQAKANNDIYIYKCHLGLYEAVAPIYDQIQILGYIMIGQVLGQIAKEIQWHALEKKFKGSLESLTTYKTYYYNLKQMKIDEIEVVSRIMKACASSIWLQYIINIERAPITERIQNYINTYYNEVLNTERICKDLKISKTTIYNYLKREYNLSLSQYINHIRLEKAKSLLKQNNTPIASIASEVGFEDYNYFSRKFKSAYGQTPSGYREAF